MDDLQTYEVDDLLTNTQYTDVNLWEMCRFNSYVIAQVNSTKKLKMKDLMQFKWDNQEDEFKEESGERQDITDEEIQQLTEMSKQFEKIL